MSRRIQFESKATARARRLKDAVLASFHSGVSAVEASFAGYDHGDWQRILYWLDISGLALYLLDRLAYLGLERCLPDLIRTRFERNLVENRERTNALFEEAAAISRAMTRRGISFA